MISYVSLKIFTRKKVVTMADEESVLLTTSAVNTLNKGRKRKINILKWKRNDNKYKRNTGQPYLDYKKRPVTGKIPSYQVSARRL